MAHPKRTWLHDFIHSHKDVKMLRTILLSFARIRAGTQANITKWLDKVDELMKKNKYERDLILQIDERVGGIREEKGKETRRRQTAGKFQTTESSGERG
jgi:hypothetical protein